VLCVGRCLVLWPYLLGSGVFESLKRCLPAVQLVWDVVVLLGESWSSQKDKSRKLFIWFGLRKKTSVLREKACDCAKVNKKLRWTLLVTFKGSLLPKPAFHQTLLEYGKSPRRQWVTGTVICGQSPRMGAKCSEVPKGLWSQLSLVAFMWSRPGGGGKGEMLGTTSEVSSLLQWRIFSLWSHALWRSAQSSPWIQRKLKRMRVCTDKL